MIAGRAWTHYGRRTVTKHRQRGQAGAVFGQRRAPNILSVRRLAWDAFTNETRVTALGQVRRP